MILVIDNYDSFVYNLVQEFLSLGEEVITRRPSSLSKEEAIKISPDYLVISPGPKRPEDARLSVELMRYFMGKVPILGVCLGHQCIAHAFGGKVRRAEKVMHGIGSDIYHDGKTIFEDIPNPFYAIRYHSLIVLEEGLPEILEISAYTAEGEIMGIRVKGTRTEGVQFHPESFLTQEGRKLIRNFIEQGREK